MDSETGAILSPRQGSLSDTAPNLIGISRVADNERALLLCFHSPVSDEQMRQIHDLLRENTK